MKDSKLLNRATRALIKHFGAFICRLLQNNNVKLRNSRFCGEREPTTVNLSLSHFTSTPFLPIYSRATSPVLYNVNEKE